MAESDKGSIITDDRSQFVFNSMSETAKKIMGAYAVGAAVVGTVRAIQGWVNSKLIYQIRVDSKDALYPYVHEWVMKHTQRKDQRTVQIRSHIGGGFYLPNSQVVSRRTVDLRHFYDGKSQIKTQVGGHKIVVGIEFRTAMAAPSDDDAPAAKKEASIVFTAKSVEASDAVHSLLRQLADERLNENVAPRLFAARWNEWLPVDDISERDISTVILKEGQIERIFNDIDTFIKREKDYVRLGAPYHRGFLFSGAPGTGKTSIARAIASHYDMDVFVVSVADLKQDASLLKLVSTVPKRSILLLEDIDVMSAATSRNDEGERATLSGLLNALDGVGTPHGLITIMSSNRPENLDPALIRPGRVDLIEEFTAVDEFQLRGLFKSFYGVDVDLPPLDREITPSQVVEAIKRNMDDSHAALISLFKDE